MAKGKKQKADFLAVIFTAARECLCVCVCASAITIAINIVASYNSSL